MRETTKRTRLIALVIFTALTAIVASCGADPESGVRVVSVDTGAETLTDAPANLVVLDVRTPEEFNEARLDGAIMINFYDDDFEEQIAELDREAPYVMYCRSGNRSGQAREIMEGLGFTDVSDIDGGINAWTAAGQPVVAG